MKDGIFFVFFPVFVQNVPHHKHTEKAKEKEVASKTERSDGQRSVLVVALRQKKKYHFQKHVTEGGRSAGGKEEEAKQNLQKSLMGPSGWQQRETI